MSGQPRPRLKLCETCDELSFVRSPRDLRCRAPKKDGGQCWSRDVDLVSVARVNKERQDLRLARDLADARAATLASQVANHEDRIALSEERGQDLARRVRDLEDLAREWHDRYLAEKDRADALAHELHRRGLRLEDLR